MAHLESALRWISTELDAAEKNPAYKKETLITNLRDRVDATLKQGHYKRRDPVDVEHMLTHGQAMSSTPPKGSAPEGETE